MRGGGPHLFTLRSNAEKLQEPKYQERWKNQHKKHHVSLKHTNKSQVGRKTKLLSQNNLENLPSVIYMIIDIISFVCFLDSIY